MDKLLSRGLGIVLIVLCSAMLWSRGVQASDTDGSESWSEIRARQQAHWDMQELINQQSMANTQARNEANRRNSWDR